MTMTQPERRAGQRWRLEWKSGDVFERTLMSRGPNGTSWKASEGRIWSDSYWSNPGIVMTLLSDAPPAVPKRARAPESVKVGDKFHHDMASVNWIGEVVSVTAAHAGILWHGSTWKEPILWDLPSVRKLRRFVPPLESKPAETGKDCRHCGSRANVDGCCAKAIEAMMPPAQEAPKVPRCIGHSRQTECSGPIALRHLSRTDSGGTMCCEGWLLKMERGTTMDMKAQSGTPYAGPERLPRPKLAHSHGVEDPALEDG